MTVPVPATSTLRLAWIALVLASAPILVDYFEHVFSNSWAWYAAVFPVLAVWSARSTERRASRIAPGILLIFLGIMIEIYASASGMLNRGRPGFLLAASGILATEGRLEPRLFVIMALAIPMPHALFARIGEPLLFLNIEMLSHALHAMGIPALVTLQGIERPAGLVVFKAVDVGWTSAIFASGLSWVLCARRGSTWGTTLIASSIAAVAGFAVHMLCTTALFALVTPSGIAETRIWRDALSYTLIASGAGWYWVANVRGKPEA